MNKFGPVLDAHRDRAAEAEPAPKAPSRRPELKATDSAGAGPAVGRRQDPTYGQISAYVPKELHRKARGKAVAAGTNVSDLLTAFLRLFVEDSELAARVIADALDAAAPVGRPRKRERSEP